MAKRVLVVDDEPNIVMSLRFLMEREGFEVEVAPTGEAALEALGRKPADLVLLDVMMPELDGFEVCQRIRANPAWAERQDHHADRQGRDVEREKGLALGADDYVTKPFSTRELVARVKQMLAPAEAGARPRDVRALATPALRPRPALAPVPRAGARDARAARRRRLAQYQPGWPAPAPWALAALLPIGCQALLWLLLDRLWIRPSRALARELGLLLHAKVDRPSRRRRRTASASWCRRRGAGRALARRRCRAGRGARRRETRAGSSSGGSRRCCSISPRADRLQSRPPDPALQPGGGADLPEARSRPRPPARAWSRASRSRTPREAARAQTPPGTRASEFRASADGGRELRGCRAADPRGRRHRRGLRAGLRRCQRAARR